SGFSCSNVVGACRGVTPAAIESPTAAGPMVPAVPRNDGYGATVCAKNGGERVGRAARPRLGFASTYARGYSKCTVLGPEGTCLQAWGCMAHFGVRFRVQE